MAYVGNGEHESNETLGRDDDCSWFGWQRWGYEYEVTPLVYALLSSAPRALLNHTPITCLSLRACTRSYTKFVPPWCSTCSMCAAVLKMCVSGLSACYRLLHGFPALLNQCCAEVLNLV